MTKAASWKRAHVYVSLGTWAPVRVYGWVHPRAPGLALTREVSGSVVTRPKERRRDRWTVTHVTTGKHVGVTPHPPLWPLEEARERLLRLADLGVEWENGLPYIMQLPDETRRRIVDIVAGVQ